MNVSASEANLVPQAPFGTDPEIRPKNPGYIEIKHVARFVETCIDSCNGSLGRRYFHVMENSLEMNYPTACCCFPPNCCCPGVDHIYKSYYDRGIFDQQDCLHAIGCVSGDVTIFPGEVEYVCCCVPCCDPCSCYSCCPCCVSGERIRVIPFEKYYCCCPNRACWFHNYCGLCGPKDGSPIVLCPLIHHLQANEANIVANAINNSRAEWKARLGK